tara:strand:+ start:1939 stop:2184 length:246 start_codon:yes stop_codon:yes gene_type:complete
MGDVLSMNGGIALQNATPNEDLIEELEDMLERARSGEIQTVCFAILNFDESTTYFTRGLHATRGLLGSLVLLQRDLLEDIE